MYISWETRSSFHQGKDFNLNEKEKCFAKKKKKKKKTLMKSDHKKKRSKTNIQTTIRMACPVKFAVNISIYKIQSPK